jgi:hypothetical protein
MLNLVVIARNVVSVRDGRITIITRNVIRYAVMGAIDARPQVILVVGAALTSALATRGINLAVEIAPRYHCLRRGARTEFPKCHRHISGLYFPS